MKKYLVILILLSWSFGNNCLAQLTFKKAFGTNLGFDQGYSVKQTNDGGYIISGYAWTNFSQSFICDYLIKTDPVGNLSWSKIFGNTLGMTNYGLDVNNSNNGGFIIVGLASVGGTNSNFSLLKTNNAGDSLWCKYYYGMGSAMGYSVHQTSDHGYIVGGCTTTPWKTTYDDYLMKTDSMGNVLWSKAYGGAQDEQAFSLVSTTDQGFILAGSTKSLTAGSQDIYIVKTNSLGDTLWTRRYGGPSDDISKSIVQSHTGGYVIAGSTNSFGAGESDVYLIKIDEQGNLLWSKTYGGVGKDYGNCVRPTHDNGYIIAGESESLGGELLIKTDSMGNVSWSKVLSNARGLAVATTSDGGYLVTGQVYKPSGDADVLLLKTDSLGNSGCGNIIPALQTLIPATQVSTIQTIVTSPVNMVFHYPTIFTNWGTKDTTLCVPVGFKERNTAQKFNIFPNPSTGNFVITFKDAWQNETVEIYNCMGKRIFCEVVCNTSEKEISLNNVTDGIYFVRVSSGGSQSCKKLILLNN